MPQFKVLTTVALAAAAFLFAPAAHAVLQEVPGGFGPGANIIDSGLDGFDTVDTSGGAQTMLRNNDIEFVAVQEYGMNDLATTIGASSVVEAGSFLTDAVFRFQLNNFPFSDCGLGSTCPTPSTLELRGYVGNGIYETADATAGAVIATIDMTGAVPRTDIDTDITGFIRDALLDDDGIVGFALAVPTGEVGGYPLFGQGFRLLADGNPSGGGGGGGPVPEPGSLALFGIGLGGMAWLRRRRKVV